MAEIKEKKKQSFIKDLYNQVMKSYKYDSNAKEELEKIMNSEDVRNDIQRIIKNKGILTGKEILSLDAKYRDNEFIRPLLFECKNMPEAIVKECIKDAIRMVSTARGYGGYSRAHDGLAKGLLSANFPRDIRSACINDLTKLYEAANYHGNYMYFKMNGQTAIGIAENLYYDINSNPDKLGILRQVYPDDSLSKEELNSRFEAMLEWDIDVAIDKMKDRTNAGKAKEMRHSSMLNNPNVSNSIINKILNVGEIDYYNIPEKLSDEMADDIYAVLSETLFNEEVEASAKRQATSPFLAFCKSGKFNFAQQYDFFQSMKAEYKHGINEDIADRAIWHYLYYCKDMNPEAIKTILQFASKGTQARIFTISSIPDDIKLECAPTYVEETKRNKIVRSNKGLMMALSVVGQLTTLDEKRYEAIFENKKKLEYEPRFTELYEAIATSPKTPLKYLERFESADENNIGIKIAKYGNWHGLSSAQTSKLHEIMLRNFDGNARKATINMEMYEAIESSEPKIDVKNFIEYMQEMCDKNHTIKKAIGDNLKAFDFFVKELTITYGGDKDYYMSQTSPSQFYAEQKKALVEKITRDGEVHKTKNKTLESIVLYQDEYIELMAQKNKRQPKDRDTYIDMDEMMDAGATAKTSTPSKSQPQFLDEFLDER